FIIIRRSTTLWRQQVDAEHEKALDRKPSRDILDMQIESAVLMHHNDSWSLRLVLRPRQVAHHLSSWRIDGDHFGGKAWIILRDRRCTRVVRLQSIVDRNCRRSGTCNHREAVKELTSTDAAMCEIVIEVDDLPVHIRAPLRAPIVV